MNQFGGSGSQFGGGGGSGGDEYGFFAPTRTGSAGSQFGGAPTGTVTNGFGAAPATAPAPSFGAVGGFGDSPYASVDTPPSSRAKALKVIGAVLLVAAIVVGGWFGWIRYQLSRPLTVPSSLSAMSAVDTPKVKQVKASVQQEWEQAYPGQELAIEVYSGHKQAIILAMARGTADVDKDFADAGFHGALQPVGPAQCAQIADGLVGCERSSRTLSALVLFFGGTAHDAAAALDEAWEQQ